MNNNFIEMDERKQTIPTILVVLGATGDLMAKKIVPALFNLHREKKLPQKFRLVGVSRREWGDKDLKKHLHSILATKAKNAPASAVRSFLNLAVYERLRFDSLPDYIALRDHLKKIDDELGVCTNKLFYLSVPPQFYSEILERLHKSHLTDGCGPYEGWTRVIIEKPFGNDEKSAKALDARLAGLFREEQIYRIDHYLAKEMLQNILMFRFANDLFEGEWNNRTIEKIHIRLFEKIGVEDRGAFYDRVGALQDVGQNHLLQMLALVTMDRPREYTADAIRRARKELLVKLVVPTTAQAAKGSFRAQYDGYRAVRGVAPRSHMETYFHIKGFLSGSRWEGVPIIMESGKRLHETRKEIEVFLRHERPCLCKGDEHSKNRILIQLEPKEGITIKFHSKKPGHAFEFEERTLRFEFRETEHHAQYTEEYEKLILDCIAGDQTLFVSSDEIAAMWRFIDPFVTAWKKNLVPLQKYAPDSGAIVTKANASNDADGAIKDLSRSIGVFGLGKMGSNVARQLRSKGWRVIVGNRSANPIKAMEQEGFEAAHSIEELIQKLPKPRVIWLMITAGKGVDEILFGREGIAGHLAKGDVVIDAGNSFYEDTMRRSKIFKKRGIGFMDVGFSGGPHGARYGGSLMIGGNPKAFKYLEPLFKDLSVPMGYGYFGRAGAGHFVKMVHNGIEYGMMQSLAEGFGLMKKSPFKLNLKKIAGIYDHGSVIESRLVGWLEEAFQEQGENLPNASGTVQATGEGEWTIKAGRKWGIKLPAIESAFKFRIASKKKPSYLGRILSALRNRFGGHSLR